MTQAFFNAFRDQGGCFMRIFRIFLIAAIAVSAASAGLVSAATAAQAAGGVNYVALGDSYSSGVGAGDYISSSGSCDRSTNAFPEQWADEYSPATFVSVACSGAIGQDLGYLPVFTTAAAG